MVMKNDEIVKYLRKLKLPLFTLLRNKLVYSYLNQLNKKQSDILFSFQDGGEWSLNFSNFFPQNRSFSL